MTEDFSIICKKLPWAKIDQKKLTSSFYYVSSFQGENV